MTKRKNRDRQGDGDGKPARNADGSARRPFNEALWLRDANGRFAGSVKQTSPFTDQQRIELKDYKEGNFSALNNHLSNPKNGDHSLDGQVRTIDAAIKKSVLTEDTVVFRGVKSPILAKRAEELVGKTVTPPNFLSTSTDSSVARRFAGFGKDSVVLALRAPAGTNAVHLDQFETSNNAGENELLFGRNSRIRITSVDRTRTPPVIVGEFT